MLENLVPLLDESILNTAGSIPLVFQGALRSMPTETRVETASQHGTHELTYLRQGRMRYYVGGREYVLNSGDSIVIRPDRSHTYVAEEGPVDAVCVYFGFVNKLKEGEAGMAAANVSLQDFFRFAEEGLTEGKGLVEDCFMVTGPYRQTVGRLVERIVLEKERKDYAQDLLLRCLSIELVIEVSRSLRQAWEQQLRLQQAKLRELIQIGQDYIAEHYARNISIADVANYVFLSPSYFARVFKQELGITPLAYLLQKRIEHACDLLRHTDLKVATVASRVGFLNSQRFNAAFRKQMQMTPMAYRQKRLHQEEEKVDGII